ncbi:hypothetical protein MMC13_003188 [Lambiella insularis]|nr:hypothetical protein [Lambiella insularis]
MFTEQSKPQATYPKQGKAAWLSFQTSEQETVPTSVLRAIFASFPLCTRAFPAFLESILTYLPLAFFDATRVALPQSSSVHNRNDFKPGPIFAFASLILIAGACVLIFLVLLAGAVNSNPVNQVYFLQADTSAISGAPAQSRWTLWNVCSVDANGRDACGKVSPAYPFDPQSNFNTMKGVPASFQGTNEFFYLTRFMFAFVLIALFFAVCSLFLGLFALCSRIGSYLSSVLCSVALFFQTIVAALMTAAYVIGRNNFNANGQTATLGEYAFAFVWAAMACLFLATISFCIAGVTSKKDKTTTARTGGRFGRRKTAKERGSFIDSESQRRVKDEYN